MTQQTKNGQIEITPLKDEHAVALSLFYSKVWGRRQITADEIINNRDLEGQNNPVFPGEPSPAFVFISDGMIIGYIGTMPTRFWDGSTTHVGYWMKGFMVLEEFQNGPIGYYLLKEATKHINLAGVLTVAPASRKLFEATGFKNLGKLTNFLALIKPEKVLGTIRADQLGMSNLSRALVNVLNITQKTGLAFLAGHGLGFFTYLWKRINLPSYGKYTVTFQNNLKVDADGIDYVWKEMHNNVSSTSVRDSLYLSWRYDSSESNYVYLMIWEKEHLRGLGIVRKPRENSDKRLSGLKVASLSDIFFPPNKQKIGLIILSEAQKLANKLQADALLCSVSHKHLPELLRKTGYFKLPGNVNFLIRKGPDLKLSDNLEDWWLTRGDARSDEAF